MLTSVESKVSSARVTSLMIELGQMNRLEVIRVGPYGAFLDGGELGEVMLISRSSVKPEVGETVEAFVFIDVDNTLVASVARPSIVAGECGCLAVVALTASGAFLDWGMKSDLFVPRSEQMGEMGIGSVCVVKALVDESNQRMIATARLHEHLELENDHHFKVDQPVKLLVAQQTDLGYKVVVDGTHLGLVYRDEVFQPVQVGDALSGFVKDLRADKKLDLILQKPSIEARTAIELKILDYLKKNGGQSTLTDKSKPEEIYKVYGVSKKSYKHALGALYRSRLIVLSKELISLSS